MNNITTEFSKNALDFIKNYLKIKSDIILINKRSSFNKDNNTQDMAGLLFPTNNIFKIYIDFNDTKTGFIRRLSHECVHVKQIEEKRLKYIDNNTVEFEDIIISFEDYKNKYHDKMPKFELEAFNMERKIANAFWSKNEDSNHLVSIFKKILKEEITREYYKQYSDKIHSLFDSNKLLYKTVYISNVEVDPYILKGDRVEIVRWNFFNLTFKLFDHNTNSYQTVTLEELKRILNLNI
jgi:hypothetical protein